MPCAPGATPRKMLPPPITMANCTPIETTSATSSVMRAMVARLMPKASSPIKASPESLRRTLLCIRLAIGQGSGRLNTSKSVRQTKRNRGTTPRLIDGFRRFRQLQQRLQRQNPSFSSRCLRPRQKVKIQQSLHFFLLAFEQQTVCHF